MSSHPAVARAHQELEVLSQSDEARELAMLRQRALDGYRIGLGHAHAEGKAEGLAEGKAMGLAEGKAVGLAEGKAVGLAEGLAQGQARLLLSMLVARFGLLDPAVEALVRAAGDEELLRWSLRVLDATTLGDVFTDASAPIG